MGRCQILATLWAESVLDSVLLGSIQFDSKLIGIMYVTEWTFYIHVATFTRSLLNSMHLARGIPTVCPRIRLLT